MPSKGQRVAKRQNQMKSRKRRGPRRASTQQFEVGPSVSKTRVEEEEGAVTAPATATATATMPAATAPSRRRRAKQAAETEAPPVTRFLPGELRHIGLVTLVILIILAAATVTLGGSII